MKHNILIIFTIFQSFFLYSQKNIVVDLSSSYEPIRQNIIIGGNDFFENTLFLIRNEGISLIRLHDNGDYITDYCVYSNFWIRDTDGNFIEKNPSFNPQSPDSYFWNDYDSLVNLLLDSNFHLLMRMGISYPMHEPYEPKVPPSNYDDNNNFSDFASLCAHTVKHFNKGWDNGFYHNIQYWEVWNEPANADFWTGDSQSYYQMYKQVVDSIKTVDSSVFVGGPSALPTTTIGLNPEYREDFINYCSTNNLPLDFYSWHLYLDSAYNPYSIKYFADTIRTILNNNGYENTKILLTEINFNLHQIGDLPDSPYGSAFYSSLLLTALNSQIDALLWYPSVFNIVEPFSGIHLTKSYFVLSKFYEILSNSDYIIATNSDEVVEGHWNENETNLMSIVLTNSDTSALYIFLSNLNSTYEEFNFSIENLPWNSKKIQVKRYALTNYENFEEQTYYYDFSSNIQISENNLPSPSVLVLEITPTNYSGSDKTDELIIQNPIIHNFKILNPPTNIKSYSIFDEKGKLLKKGTDIHKIDVSDYKRGFYFIQIHTNDKTLSGKFIKW